MRHYNKIKIKNTMHCTYKYMLEEEFQYGDVSWAAATFLGPVTCGFSCSFLHHIPLVGIYTR